MNEKHAMRGMVSAPRFVRRGRIRLVGFRMRFTEATMNGIPALWERFAPHIGSFPEEVPGVAYGVCVRPCAGETGFDYMAAVEVGADGADGVEAGVFQRLEIPALEYAVFDHAGHVAKLAETVEGIQRDWVPRLRRALADDDPEIPAFFERYGPGFDPERGEGDVEVWVPVGR